MKLHLILLLCCAAVFSFGSENAATELDPNMKLKPVNTDGIRYLLPAEAPLRLTGFNWYGKDHVYRRIPADFDVAFSQGVNNLSWHSAGGQVAFRTDSTRVVLKVEMRSNGTMSHMATTGSGSFDVYIGEGSNQRCLGAKLVRIGSLKHDLNLFNGDRKMRTFTINFPLYSGVNQVFVGVDENAKVEPPPAWKDDRPIVVYGTSITQGGCATRPGMAYTNILSRQLNRPVLNFGFSGNGKGEPQMAELLASIENPSLYILDYEANVSTAAMKNTLANFIGILRKKHPTVPILILTRTRTAWEGRDRGRSENLPLLGQAAATHDVQKNVWKELSATDKNIHFQSGADLLGADFDECMVDGLHLTDLGFYRLAHGIAPLVEKLASGK